MASDDGYRHEQSDRTLTSVVDEGWELSSPVPGFMPQACYRQRMQGQREQVVQWVFSDGLATVSLFMESLNAETHPREELGFHGGDPHADAASRQATTRGG